MSKTNTNGIFDNNIFFYSIIVSFVLLLLFTIGYVTGDQKTKDQINDFLGINDKQTINQEEIKKIVKNMYLSEPEFTFGFEKDGKERIVAIINQNYKSKLVFLEKFADRWIDSKVFYQNKCDYCGEYKDIATTTDEQGNQFVMFTGGSQGTGMGTFQYNLVSFDGNSQYSMSVTGVNTQGGISMDSVEKDPEIMPTNAEKILENYVASSSYIYKDKPNNNIVDIEYDTDPSKSQARWIYFNKDCRDAMYRGLFNCSINMPEYSTDLFSYYDWSVSKEVSSNKYIVRAMFKGPVIAKRLSDNKAFVVWVPNDIYNWVDQLSLEGNKVSITERNNGISFTTTLH